MNLKELRAKLEALREKMRELFEQAKSTREGGEPAYDFQAVTCVPEATDLEGGAKSIRVAEYVQTTTHEINDIAEQVETLEAAEKGLDTFGEGERTIKRPTHPNGVRDEPQKSFGQMVVQHPAFKAYRPGGQNAVIELPEIGLLELKTLFITTAGWPPESTRIGLVVDAVTRPIQVTDIIPASNTGMSLVVFMQETTRTHAAAEVAEGAQVAESTFVLTEANSPVRRIGVSIPVTDDQLEDVAQVESYLNGRLSFGVMQRLDTQILVGDGIAPNLDGLENVAGIQTQARGADPNVDAFFKAMTLVRDTGRASPTHALIPPGNWETIRLSRTADGIYIWGNPSEQGVDRMWGLPVVLIEAGTANLGWIGSFSPQWISLAERKGVTVEMGLVDDQFTGYRQTIRASGRWALVVGRPAAFATVTGLN